jgi:hypothetical protein
VPGYDDSLDANPGSIGNKILKSPAACRKRSKRNSQQVATTPCDNGQATFAFLQSIGGCPAAKEPSLYIKSQPDKDDAAVDRGSTPVTQAKVESSSCRQSTSPLGAGSADATDAKLTGRKRAAAADPVDDWSESDEVSATTKEV